MAVEVISTTTLTWADGDPAGQSINIPADCTAVYAFFSAYSTTPGTMTQTLAGNAPDQKIIHGTYPNSGVVAWYNPSTGSQTIDIAWVGTNNYSRLMTIVYVKGGDTSAWRDADLGGAESGTVNVTVDSAATDLVLGWADYYAGSEVYPSTPSGWTSLQTQYRNGTDYSSRLSSGNSPGASSITYSAAVNYSVITVVSIPEASGGGSVVPIIMQAMDQFNGGIFL